MVDWREIQALLRKVRNEPFRSRLFDGREFLIRYSHYHSIDPKNFSVGDP